MIWLQLLLLAVLATTFAGCELAGNIFKAGAWVGAVAVIVVVLIVGFVIAKIRG
jgi:hypothetical protein